MNWKPELDDLARREAFAREMGGVDKVKRQRDQGRLTVRERIDKLVDAKSFHEVGAISGIAEYDEHGELSNLTPANCVFGRGKIDGRTVVVVGDDFTVRGGSADASISAKPLMAEEMAHDFRLPIIRLIEGSGGGGSVKTIETKGAANLPGGIGGTRAYLYTTANMARVPVVGLGLGSVAGLGAARLAASHYSIMTKNSAMFVAGPPVVKRLGQDLTKQELGGADIQTRAGGVDRCRRYRGGSFCLRAGAFCPICRRRSMSCRRRLPCDDDPERAEESLMKAVPRNRRQVYKMRPIIDAVVDKGSFFEINANFGRPMIAGLARLEGRAVLLLASDPFHYGGSWTADACQKVVRWVDFAETFHLPVVYLMDCPGFMIGLEAEKAATIRHGVRAMAAVNQTTVPWCTIIVRNSFGVAGVVHQPADRYLDALCLAIGLLGLAAAGRRHRGGLSRRHRRIGRSQGQAAGDRGSPQQAALAVPLGREILGRGDHRPAQDPFAAVRIRAARRADAHAGAGDQYDDQAVTSFTSPRSSRGEVASEARG